MALVNYPGLSSASCSRGLARVVTLGGVGDIAIIEVRIPYYKNVRGTTGRTMGEDKGFVP